MELDLSRVRRPSRRFGWVDRRILMDGHLAALGPIPTTLYLVLCGVADRHGVSWYSPGRLAQWVKCPPDRVLPALEALVSAGLVARTDRYVQVLDLDWFLPAPGNLTRVTARRQAPVPQARPLATARQRLAELPVDVRNQLLERARGRFARFIGGREPSQSALEAVAASLIDREVA